MILAGDVGGTKCTLIWFAENGSSLDPVFRLSLPTRDFSSFEALLDAFRAALVKAGHPWNSNSLSAAAFGVAGAVVDGSTVERAWARGLEVSGALTSFDAYPLFRALGDAIEIGPTGNNLRDLRILLAY